MAGFDFDFEASPVGTELQRTLLRWSQRAATDMDLTLTWRTSNVRVRVEVNGSLPPMWALHERLTNDFEVIASSYPAPSRRSDRLRIANDILMSFREGLSGITAAVHEISERLNGVPRSIVFEYGSKSHLARVLRSLSYTLVLDMQGRVSKRNVVEEAHGALEQVLRTYLGREGRALTLQQMIDAVHAGSVITADHARDLQRLRLLRNAAKHSSQEFDDAEASHPLAVAIEVLHRVLPAIRGARPSPDAHTVKGS